MLGNFLKKYRGENGLSLNEFSKLVNISPAYLHKLETQERKNPSVKVLQNLSIFFNLPMEYFVKLATGEETGKVVEISDLINSRVFVGRQELTDCEKKKIIYYAKLLKDGKL